MPCYMASQPTPAVTCPFPTNKALYRNLVFEKDSLGGRLTSHKCYPLPIHVSPGLWHRAKVFCIQAEDVHSEDMHGAFCQADGGNRGNLHQKWQAATKTDMPPANVTLFLQKKICMCKLSINFEIPCLFSGGIFKRSTLR